MIEIIIYLTIALSAFAYRTVLSGRKNGCFYHKNDNPLPKMLEREIKNLHFIETPAWYCQTIGIFFFTFAITRLINSDFNINILIGLIASLLISIGAYTLPSYWYQRGVTAGLKKDDELDDYDKEYTEVAIVLFGKKIQFWKKQLFYNKRRKLAIYVGILEIIIGFSLFFFLK
jgi:hypothetical protein